MACRNSERAENAIKDIIDATKEVPNVGKLRLVELNLSSLKSIRECCSKLLHNYDRIDLLINNAGIMSCPYGKTEDGFEIQFGTNHLGHILLTLLLLPRIMKSTPARIVNVSSVAHRGKIISCYIYSFRKKFHKYVWIYGGTLSLYTDDYIS